MIKNLLLLTIFCSLTLCGPWPFSVIREASYGVVKGLTYIRFNEAYMLDVVCKSQWKKVYYNITSNIADCYNTESSFDRDCKSGGSWTLNFDANLDRCKNAQLFVAIGREDFKDDYLQIGFQSAVQQPRQKHADNLQIQ